MYNRYAEELSDDQPTTKGNVQNSKNNKKNRVEESPGKAEEEEHIIDIQIDSKKKVTKFYLQK